MAGGIDWFRWHHGSVTDPKFQLVARKAGASLPEVLAVWAFVLEQASASEDRGSFSEIDAEAVDCLFGLGDGTTAAILDQMAVRGLLAGSKIANWEKRQPKRERDSDGSTERVRAHRERQRQQQPDVAIVGHETPCNATKRQETPRGEERREEISPTNVGGGKPRKRDAAPAQDRPDDVDAQTWADWLALRKAKRAPVTPTVVNGARAEADKAGMTLDAFLQVWCRRGSQGLEAGWLKPDERVTPSRVVPISFAQQDEQARRRRWEEMTGRKWPDDGQMPEFVDVQPIERISA